MFKRKLPGAIWDFEVAGILPTPLLFPQSRTTAWHSLFDFILHYAPSTNTFAGSSGAHLLPSMIFLSHICHCGCSTLQTRYPELWSACFVLRFNTTWPGRKQVRVECHSGDFTAQFQVLKKVVEWSWWSYAEEILFSSQHSDDFDIWTDRWLDHCPQRF